MGVTVFIDIISMDSSNCGVYQIRIRVDKNCSIPIGKLSIFTFPKGKYTYTGRVGKNLTQRIDRHRRLDKKCFWHIDYLLKNENVKIQDINIISQNSTDECIENQKLLQKHTSIVARDFGATDCQNDCGAHLLYLNT